MMLCNALRTRSLSEAATAGSYEVSCRVLCLVVSEKLPLACTQTTDMEDACLSVQMLGFGTNLVYLSCFTTHNASKVARNACICFAPTVLPQWTPVHYMPALLHTPPQAHLCHNVHHALLKAKVLATGRLLGHSSSSNVQIC